MTKAGIHYIVIDTMNSNNGNFRAKDKHGRMTWLNTLSIDRIDKRKDNAIIYV